MASWATSLCHEHRRSRDYTFHEAPSIRNHRPSRQTRGHPARVPRVWARMAGRRGATQRDRTGRDDEKNAAMAIRDLMTVDGLPAVAVDTAEELTQVLVFGVRLMGTK